MATPPSAPGNEIDLDDVTPIPSLDDSEVVTPAPVSTRLVDGLAADYARELLGRDPHYKGANDATDASTDMVARHVYLPNPDTNPDAFGAQLGEAGPMSDVTVAKVARVSETGDISRKAVSVFTALVQNVIAKYRANGVTGGRLPSPMYAGDSGAGADFFEHHYDFILVALRNVQDRLMLKPTDTVKDLLIMVRDLNTHLSAYVGRGKLTVAEQVAVNEYLVTALRNLVMDGRFAGIGVTGLAPSREQLEGTYVSAAHDAISDADVEHRVTQDPEYLALSAKGSSVSFVDADIDGYIEEALNANGTGVSDLLKTVGERLVADTTLDIKVLDPEYDNKVQAVVMAKSANLEKEVSALAIAKAKAEKPQWGRMSDAALAGKPEVKAKIVQARAEVTAKYQTEAEAQVRAESLGGFVSAISDGRASTSLPESVRAFVLSTVRKDPTLFAVVSESVEHKKQEASSRGGARHSEALRAMIESKKPAYRAQMEDSLVQQWIAESTKNTATVYTVGLQFEPKAFAAVRSTVEQGRKSRVPNQSFDGVVQIVE